MVPGLTGGALAAIVAVLVSLPLRSPSAVLFNSATVCLAALAAGVLAGLIWFLVRRSQRPVIRFLVAWSVIFLPLAGLVILLGRSQLDNFVIFAAPLALIMYAIIGTLTVSIPRFLPSVRWWYAAGAVAIALALGFGLITQTDQESGRLELPPPGSQHIPQKGFSEDSYGLL